MAVAVDPCWLYVGPQPRRGHDRETVQGVAHGFPDQFEPVEGPDGRQNMGGIGALRPPCFEEVAFLQLPQQRLQEQVFRSPMDEARAELAQDRRIKAGIGQLQGQRIFPIDPPADGIRGLAVRQAFGELQHQHQRQPGGGFGRLPGRGKEGRKLSILIEGAERIAHLHTQGPLGKCGVGDHGPFLLGWEHWGTHVGTSHTSSINRARGYRPSGSAVYCTSSVPDCIPIWFP